VLFVSIVVSIEINRRHYFQRGPRIKENAEALVVASKENGLEVNADKTKYMVMS
jgi:hypothetical protein